MKLSEIHVMHASYEDYSEDKIADIERHALTLPPLKKLPHEMQIRKDGKTNPFYFLLKGEELVGWLKFKKVRIAKEHFNKLELIYILPRFRKGVAGSYLILHMKDLSKLPIVAGGAKEQGGMLLRDGAELVTALAKRKDLFSVSQLDLSTGERSPLPDVILTDKNATVVIENLLPAGLNEQFALPPEVNAETFDERQDWLGDVS